MSVADKSTGVTEPAGIRRSSACPLRRSGWLMKTKDESVSQEWLRSVSMLIEGVARTVGHPPDLDVSRSAQILAKFPVVNKVLILGGYAGPHDLLRKNRQWQLIFEARS